MKQSWKSAFRGRKSAGSRIFFFRQISTKYRILFLRERSDLEMVCLTQLSRQVGRVCHMQQSSGRDARRVEGARGNKHRLFLPARTAYLTLSSESCLRSSIWPNAPRRSKRYRVAWFNDNKVSGFAGKLEVPFDCCDRHSMEIHWLRSLT